MPTCILICRSVYLCRNCLPKFAARGKFFCVFVLLLAPLSSGAQMFFRAAPFPQPTEITTLKNTIRLTTSPSQKAEALTRLGFYYVQTPYPRTPNITTALRLAKEASEISRSNNLQNQYNDAQLLIGYVYLRKEMPDSVVKVLPTLNDSSRFRLLLTLAYFVRTKQQGSNRDSLLSNAMNFALQAQVISKKLNDTLKNIEVRQEIAGIRSEYNNPDIKSEEELLDILKALKGVGYKNLQYIYLELFGTALLEGNEDKAMQYSTLALKSQEQSSDSTLVADLHFAHGIILRRKGDNDQAVHYLKAAVELYKKRYGTAGIDMAIIPLIDVFVKAKRPDEGDRFISKLFREYPPDNLSDSLERLSAMASFYRVIKRYDKAEMYMLMNIDLSKRNGRKPIPYQAMGQIYVEARQFEKAKPYLLNALATVDNKTSVRTKGHLYYCLFVTDSALGNYLSAIGYLNENKRCDDILFTQSKADALEKYKTQFETEKKEDSLKFKDQHISLLTQTTNLQQENLRQSYLVRNITIAGIVLSLIVISLLYYQYRTKQKSNAVISKKNNQLQKLVNEKEWLLKEVHHRVKNNLQTVVSLLELQSEYLDNDALSAIQASQNRIYATSLLHQKLYRSENISSVNMNGYLHELIHYLKDAYNIRNDVRFVANITPIELDVTQAVPLGLIVNEAITNSFKYAFDKQKQNAEIMLSLAVSEGMADLMIADNGKGFDEAKGKESTGIGLKLIKGLAEDIDGEAQIDAINGTNILIRFKPRLPLESVVNHQEELTV